VRTIQFDLALEHSRASRVCGQHAGSGMLVISPPWQFAETVSDGSRASRDMLYLEEE